ncbi:MAG: PBECR2 nuclease fold domain-containing protein [Bdellovibrionota bacterium]
MSKTSPKRRVEKRKRSRTSSRGKRVGSKTVVCAHCSEDLSGSGRALFVEEDVGRIFCHEECITAYFGPEMERLEKQYFRNLRPNELSVEDRHKLADLRWMTVQEPDEIWCEKTISGDRRYTLISAFQPEGRKIWSVCLCLFLRGEPSFMFLSFITKNDSMVNAYRKGEKVPLIRKDGQKTADADHESESVTDRLADNWTEEETYRARLSQHRSDDDIPFEEFSLYQSCLEETLDKPDEVWVTNNSPDGKTYHFIRSYTDEKPTVWYIVTARDTDDDDHIEIIDAFPTRDAALVDQYRAGEQEVGQPTVALLSRLVH